MRAGTPASSAPGSWSRGTMLSATASRVASDAASRGPTVGDWAKAVLGLHQTMEVHRKLPRKVRRPDLSEVGSFGAQRAEPRAAPRLALPWADAVRRLARHSFVRLPIAALPGRKRACITCRDRC